MTAVDRGLPARVVQLDLLRCVAVLLVLGRHAAAPEPQLPWFVQTVAEHWRRGGWIGVDLFFVLSGFLVSGLLFSEARRHGRLSVGTFLIRRGLKIYPAFWTLMIFSVVAARLLDRPLPSSDVAGELLFLQNYLGSLWPHTWSLAVEEHFYFLLAVVFAWLMRGQRAPAVAFAGIPRLFVGVALVCLALRMATALSSPYSHQTHLYATHLRLDSLLFGTLLSYGWHFGPLATTPWLGTRWRRLCALLLGCALLSPAFVFELRSTPWISVLGVSLFALGSGLVLLASLRAERPRGPLVAACARVGVCSYSVYLWHMPVQGVILPALQDGAGLPLDNWWLYMACYVGGAIVLGIVAAWLVELPVMRLRERWVPSRGC